MPKYFIRCNGKTYGPASVQKITDRIQSGVFSLYSYVSLDQKDWFMEQFLCFGYLLDYLAFIAYLVKRKEFSRPGCNDFFGFTEPGDISSRIVPDNLRGVATIHREIAPVIKFASFYDCTVVLCHIAPFHAIWW